MIRISVKRKISSSVTALFRCLICGFKPSSIAEITPSLVSSSFFGRRSAAGVSNINFGYFAAGGIGATLYSRVDRLNFSNDTAGTSIRGPLSSTRYSHSSTGNSNFGYFGGGYGPSVSIVDRIDYSNDTTSASIRGSLSQGRQSSAATGNSNFGYFGGGFNNGPPIVSVNRIDYSNDLSITSVRGSLSLARGRLAATTNAASS